MKHELELKLQAWLDGELPPAEAERMRLFAESNPEAKKLVADLQGIKTAFLQPEHPIALPETPEFYWSKIERQIGREQTSPPSAALPWARRWRLWLAPLAGASALVAVLLLAVRPSPPSQLVDHVSAADGYQARTIRDQASGLNLVYLQQTPKTSSSAAAKGQSARIREDGPSFAIDIE